MNEYRPIIWLFGLPSAGKSTLAQALCVKLTKAGRRVVALDGDVLRGGVCSDLSFTDEDRSENIRRSAEIAKLLASQGLFVVCAFVTPNEQHRVLVKRILGEHVSLIHVDCPLEMCIARDVKGLYAEAASGRRQSMTGIQQPFDPPKLCDFTVITSSCSVESCADKICEELLNGSS
ncbi:MAG: cysC [Verrucomicrobiales bacterium]|nr:cysC [Verrucomicrobiales bacterium]